MPTAPTQTINNHQKNRYSVGAQDFDGNPDLTATLGVASTNSSVATATIAPDDPRAVDVVSGSLVATVNIIVTSPVNPSNPLTIPVSVTAAPNLGGVSFVGAGTPVLK